MVQIPSHLPASANRPPRPGSTCDRASQSGSDKTYCAPPGQRIGMTPAQGRLPEICQSLTDRSRQNTLSADGLGGSEAFQAESVVRSSFGSGSPRGPDRGRPAWRWRSSSSSPPSNGGVPSTHPTSSALVRGGAWFQKGLLVERPDESGGRSASRMTRQFTGLEYCSRKRPEGAPSIPRLIRPWLTCNSCGAARIVRLGALSHPPIREPASLATSRPTGGGCRRLLQQATGDAHVLGGADPCSQAGWDRRDRIGGGGQLTVGVGADPEVDP